MTHGTITLKDGTQFNCNLDITENFTNVNQSYIGKNNFFRSGLSVSIKIITQHSNRSLFYNMVNSKTNFTFDNFKDKIEVIGLIINNINNYSNGDISIEGDCDYYQGKVLTKQEEKRIIREKKLKRIMK